jgi:hypothetical protein
VERANPLVFVVRDSEGWTASAATQARPFPTVEHEGQTGWWFASLFSPAAAASVAPVRNVARHDDAFDMVQAESGRRHDDIEAE